MAVDKNKELAKLRSRMLKADLPLRKTAQNLVFGEGSCDPRVFFIGEAPGADEDRKGLPFAGAAGRYLDLLLDSIELTREAVYITSILKYRPPGNRPPAITEIKAHAPFLIDQIRIIRPLLVVPLGNFAARFILSGLDIAKMSVVPGITQIHGKIQSIRFEDMRFDVIPVFHPAAVLYKRPLKKILLEDFQIIKRKMEDI